MPLNIADAEDSFLIGKARVDEFKQDFLFRWFGPLIRSQFGIQLETMTPEQKEQLLADPNPHPMARRLMEQRK